MTGRQRFPGLLLLYEDPLSPDAGTIFEHLAAFERYCRLPVHRVNVALGFPPGLAEYDFSVVVCHYSLRSLGHWLTPEYRQYLASCSQSYKVAIFQDEIWYFTERLDFLNRYRIDCLYTRHKPQHWNDIYGEARTLKKRVHYRAGYVSPALIASAEARYQTLEQRPVDVAYRGRRLPYYLGLASQEKTRIAEQFLQRAEDTGLRLDIATDERERQYGTAWHDFLARARAVLGVEGGVSVIDLDGTFRRLYQDLVSLRPALTFEEFAAHAGNEFRQLEDRIDYRALTPRHLEAAAFRNVQVLFEGRYDSVLAPNTHYIPLRKDFSNFADVVAQLGNVDRLHAMVERTYQDLIASGSYSYEGFIHSFDEELHNGGVQFDQPDPTAQSRLTAYLDDWHRFRAQYFHTARAIARTCVEQPALQRNVEFVQALLEKFTERRFDCRAAQFTPTVHQAKQRLDRRFWDRLARCATFDLRLETGRQPNQWGPLFFLGERVWRRCARLLKAG